MRAGEDTVVNNELWRRGHFAYRAQDVVLVHRSPCTTPRALVRHHFIRGRAFGRMIRRPGDGRRRSRIAAARYLNGYAMARLRDTDRRVADWGEDLRSEYTSSRRLVKLGIAAAWAGTWIESMRR
jgi:hypothetical protein